MSVVQVTVQQFRCAAPLGRKYVVPCPLCSWQRKSWKQLSVPDMYGIISKHLADQHGGYNFQITAIHGLESGKD